MGETLRSVIDLRKAWNNHQAIAAARAHARSLRRLCIDPDGSDYRKLMEIIGEEEDDENDRHQLRKETVLGPG